MPKKKEAQFDPTQFPLRIANQSAPRSSRVRITGDSGPSMQFTAPMPYQPEFASPERVQWPIDRLQQNRYWRLFCFAPGTPVVLSDGTRKNIEDITKEDLVITHKNNTKAVTNTFKHFIDEDIYKLYISRQSSPLIVTGEHPFLIHSKTNETGVSWKNTRDIIETDKLLSLPETPEKGYVRHSVTKIEKIKYTGYVYNIEVEDDNTYLVGQVGYITHNCKTDPVISTVVDLYAEIIASDFTVSGEGVDGSIKDAYEYMIEKTNIISAFKYFISEYLVLGEVIPHLVFDDSKGIWTKLIFHNPDQIKVIDSPFIAMDPILEFTPDETLRALARSTNPTVMNWLSSLPPEVQEAVVSGRNIPLDTKLNATFLARKIHPYDVRGTSVFTRMYRILLYEDAIANCSIATARRHASPLKIAKLGDKDLRWVPEQSYQDKIIELLTVAEQDPHSFMVLPWFVNFEAFGVTERAMNIGREWDIIERIKLTAMGVSQGFLHGECFVKDTRVLTESYTNKSIQDIKIGEKVIDKNGHTQTVTNAWQSETPANLTEIKLVGGKTLTSTNNHKYPVWAWMRTCGCGCGEAIKAGHQYKKDHSARVKEKIELIPTPAVGDISRPRSKGILKDYNPYQKLEASEIRPYDCLMIPRKFDEIAVPQNITLDHAKLLGFYASEGCYTISGNKDYGTIQWTFNKNEEHTYAQEVKNAGTNLDMFFSSSLKKGNTCVVQAARQTYQPFYDWLLFNGGRYSHGKQFSSDVMRWPLKYKEEIIKGLFKGDGSRSYLTKHDKRVKKDYGCFVVQYLTVSEILADQVSLMLSQLGIYGSIKKRRMPKNKNLKSPYVYDIRCYGVYAQKLAKLVWNEDVVLPGKTRTKVWLDDNYIYVPVKSATTIENKDKTAVYNLTVDGDHSYLAEGIGSHNSTYACFAGNTEISTDFGIYKPIQDIKIGEKVIDKEGDFQFVENAWKEDAPDNLTEIKLVGGKTLTSTNNHKFPVWAWPRNCGCGCGTEVLPGRSYVIWHKGKSSNHEFVPVGAKVTVGRHQIRRILESYNPYQTLEASQIHKKDYLMIPRKFDAIIVPKNITLSHAKLLGYYIAEGCYQQWKNDEGCDGISWTFNKNEKDTHVKDLCDAALSLGMKFFSSTYDDRNTCVIHTRKQSYASFYDWLLFNGGRYSSGKHLSSDVMKWPLSYKEELIRSMFKGDGSYGEYEKINKKQNTKHKQFSVQYTTTSKILADQICVILAQLGIFAAITKVDNIKRNLIDKYHRQPTYLLRIHAEHARKLSNLVWGIELNSNFHRSRVWVDDNYLYVPVKSVTTIENKDQLPVYNLTVSGNHSYLAEGVGTYNSMRGNLQTLLMRLNGLRQFFVSSWFIPKFFRPIAEMNEWVKRPKKSDNKGGFRKKQGALCLPDEENYIIPDIRWSRSLDSKTDTELMDTYEQVINRLGIPLSKKTVFPAAGVDYESEMKNLAQEKLDAEKLSKEMGVSEQTITGNEPEEMPSGGGPAGAPVGEEESIPLTPVEEGGEALPEATPAGASKKVSFWKEKIAAREKSQKDAEVKKRAKEVRDLVNDEVFTELTNLIKTGKSSPYWKSILKKDEKPEEFSKNFDWERVSAFLYSDGLEEYHIEGIRQELIKQEVIDPSREDKLRAEVSGLQSVSLDFLGSNVQLDRAINQVISSGDLEIAAKVNRIVLGPPVN